MQKDNDKNIEDIAELFLSLVEGGPVEDGVTLEEHDKHYKTRAGEPNPFRVGVKASA